MTTKRVAVDANLLLLLIVGSVAPEYISRHKRLKIYQEADYDLLSEIIARPDGLVATPCTSAEVSNIVGYGVADPFKARFVDAFKALIGQLDERYQLSRHVVLDPEFVRLGLSDCAWLCSLDDETELLTADLPLYLVAMSRGLKARNFTHMRDVAWQT